MSALPPGAVLDRASLIDARTDRSGTPGISPIALVRAESIEHVQEVLRWATRTRTPVVPRGAGTGIAGAATVVGPAVVLDLTGLDRIVSLDATDGIAFVEPGVITAQLDAAARSQGLFYGPDPASAQLSTLGGNLATNAGGMRCLKYGGTRESVLALDVVLADGRLLHTGANTLKSVTGYDLTSLFVGSEGTLGVIVGATLRLLPIPAGTATLAATFADVAAAAAGAEAIAHARLAPAVMELLDATTLATIDLAQGTELSARGGSLLIVQADGGDAAEQVARIAEVLAPSATWLEHSDDPGRSAELIAARRLALPSIAAFANTLIEDVCVPRSRLAEAVRGIAEISADSGVTVHTFAHAGDGTLHPILSWDRELADPPAEVFAAAGRIFQLALDLGGTLTGEHGVGLLKRSFAAAELGDVGLAVHRAIKAALDPLGLLNPGKAF